MKYFLHRNFQIIPLFICLIYSVDCIKVINPVKPLESLNNQTLSCTNNCLKCEKNICVDCEKGYHRYLNGCYLSCPFDTFADNYSSMCKHSKEQPVFIKAYTVSRCMNSCGKVFPDCSCNPRCKKFGNCCSDYKFCDLVSNNHATNCIIPNCKYCSKTSNNQICLQCDDNYYYFNNQCHSKCPPTSKTLESNKFCYPLSNNECMMENCEQCEENSSNCKKCMNGHFLYNKKCVKACPIKYHADRIKFTCNLRKDFSFFWIFPSTSTCKNNCGTENLNRDCSCKSDCMRKGNCCDDFEKFCESELHKDNCVLCDDCDKSGRCNKCKSNSIFKNEKCECLQGYVYENEEDECVKQVEKSYLKSNNNYSSNQLSNNNNFIKNELMKSFDQIGQLGNFDPNNMMNNYLNGNVTINSLHGNTDTQIIEDNNIVVNSNNVDNSNKTNINSYNQISNIVNRGNVNKNSNYGTISNGNINNGYPSSGAHFNPFINNIKEDGNDSSNSFEKELEDLGNVLVKEILNPKENSNNLYNSKKKK